MDIQTDLYLEELTDVVPEVENATQTDAFLDRPPTPVFVPQKTGTDANTQIEAGELFNFDYEVDPILEVLTGKVRSAVLTLIRIIVLTLTHPQGPDGCGAPAVRAIHTLCPVAAADAAAVADGGDREPNDLHSLCLGSTCKRWSSF